MLLEGKGRGVVSGNAFEFVDLRNPIIIGFHGLAGINKGTKWRRGGKKVGRYGVGFGAGSRGRKEGNGTAGGMMGTGEQRRGIGV